MTNSTIPASRFFDIFDGLIIDVGDPNCVFGRRDAVLKKLIWMSMLDTLSAVAFSGEKSVRKRFTRFVSTYCAWGDCERVSLPHLLVVLEANPSPNFDKLLSEVRSRLGKWLPSGGALDLDADPLCSELAPLWPISCSGFQETVNRRTLDDMRHVSLLYELRCNLVHELRSRGPEFQGVDWKDDSPAYWYLRSDGPWELSYPELFVQGLCRSGLANLKAYFDRTEHSTLTNFALGPFFIPEFNELWQTQLQAKQTQSSP
ncbi:MAG TPA: hypothetical protein VGL38_10570 [bacterium]|jgi:hypothetical protein